MVTKSIELFVICSDGEKSSRMEECFDTFEDARSHISDMDEGGRHYKYSGYWGDRQVCYIERLYIEPGMKRLIRTNTWAFKDGNLDMDYSCIWNEEHAYKGEVW